ncbi:hypothetical protein RHDC3_00587 [Rhodocyclaceae bacterium]|nr:hypothetical protein RHDC3_00587 [Rhodocyclaceae bacterium]
MVRLLTVLMMMPFLAGTALAQDGKIYKIVNPDGSVGYSDRPPSSKGASAREMELGPGSSGIRPITPEEVEEANARSKARLDDMERERQQAAQRAREEEKAAEQPPEEVYAPVAGDPWIYPRPRPRPRPLPADGRVKPGKDPKGSRNLPETPAADMRK